MSGIKMIKTKCPICGDENAVENPVEGGNTKVIICDKCWRFTIDNNTGINSNVRHLIAGYLYETKDYHLIGKDRVEDFTSETTKRLLASPAIPKTSMQRLDKFLLNIYNIGKDFNISFTHDEFIPQMGYAKNKGELNSMMGALCDLGYLRYSEPHETYYITINGLQHAEELLSSNKESTKAFIAMKFSDEMKVIRDTVIKPVAGKCGFDAITVDQEEHNDGIPDRIIAEIKTSRFVIADFTNNNHGVYYEAGYAKGLGIPVIKMCNKKWFDDGEKTEDKELKLHFDVKADNFIIWEDEEDLAKRLEARIRATIL